MVRLLYWHRGGKLCVRSVVEPVSARFSRIIGTFGPASGHHNVAFVATDRSFPCEYVHDLSHSLSLCHCFPFTFLSAFFAALTRCRAKSSAGQNVSRRDLERDRNRRTGPPLFDTEISPAIYIPRKKKQRRLYELLR